MDSIKKLTKFKQLKFERQLLTLLRKYGIDRSKVEEIPEKFANRKPEKGINYWYYNGPLDEKTRPFCRLMLKIGKVFTDEEIQKISDELGYPVDEFKGSFGCRHSWIRFRGKIIYTPKPTIRDIRKLINVGVEYDPK